MVDVSNKPATRRSATAETFVTMSPSAVQTVRQGDGKKGDVLTVARIAAIQATKSTSQLIPLCHAIPIESVAVTFQWITSRGESQSPETPPQESAKLHCSVTCVTSGKTGIEMEALTGASIAALTVYDMLKSVDRDIQIGPTRLVKKSGGVSGDFVRRWKSD